MVEGIEGLVALDRELEAVTGGRVLDRDAYIVFAGMPEQKDAEAVAFADGEFARRRCF